MFQFFIWNVKRKNNTPSLVRVWIIQLVSSHFFLFLCIDKKLYNHDKRWWNIVNKYIYMKYKVKTHIHFKKIHNTKLTIFMCDKTSPALLTLPLELAYRIYHPYQINLYFYYQMRYTHPFQNVTCGEHIYWLRCFTHSRKVRDFDLVKYGP
jgi:hypothetical protein